MPWALVATGELVFDADADVAAQGRIADGVLVVLVEQVGGAGVEGYAARECVTARYVEAGVARIATRAAPVIRASRRVHA